MFFKESLFVESTVSTNELLKNGDFTDRTLLYTFNQENGRGRSGKQWFTGAGKGVALSVLLKENAGNIAPLWFIACFSLALLDLLSEFRVGDCWIKWPNDIYSGSEKIAGILTESSWIGDKHDKTVIGIGFNVNETYEELSGYNKHATSILVKTGVNTDLTYIVEEYIDILSEWLSLLVNKNDIEKIKKRWLIESRIVGKKVVWNNTDAIYECVVKDIGNDGSLIVKLTSGETAVVVSGEIILKENFDD